MAADGSRRRSPAPAARPGCGGRGDRGVGHRDAQLGLLCGSCDSRTSSTWSSLVPAAPRGRTGTRSAWSAATRTPRSRAILFAVDPVHAVVDEAVEWGADLLVVAPPAVPPPAPRSPPHPEGPGRARAGRATAAACSPRTPTPTSPAGGVSEALAAALGLADVACRSSPTRETALDKLVVFVPARRTPSGVGRRSPTAGAGRDRRLRPVHLHARPARARSGRCRARSPRSARSARSRWSPRRGSRWCCRGAARHGVVAALRAAHPYEEPAYDVLELADRAGPPRRPAGSACCRSRSTLREFADQVAHGAARRPRAACGWPATPTAMVEHRGGVRRRRGLPARRGARGRAPTSYVTSDLRHHPASEFREQPDGPALVDVPHWAAEWTWLPVAAERLVAALGRAWRDTVDGARSAPTTTDPGPSGTDHCPRSTALKADPFAQLSCSTSRSSTARSTSCAHRLGDAARRRPSSRELARAGTTTLDDAAPDARSRSPT